MFILIWKNLLSYFKVRSDGWTIDGIIFNFGWIKNNEDLKKKKPYTHILTINLGLMKGIGLSVQETAYYLYLF